MLDVERVIRCLDADLERKGKARLTAIEANELLSSEGILRDSKTKPGAPLRRVLRQGFLPHAYQEPDKPYGKWFIPDFAY